MSIYNIRVCPFDLYIIYSFCLCAACAIGGTFIIAAAYAGCDITVVGTFFTIAVGAQGLNSASLTLNPMDLSPNYAGMLVGVIGTFSCCMGIVVPVAISRLAPNVSLLFFCFFESIDSILVLLGMSFYVLVCFFIFLFCCCHKIIVAAIGMAQCVLDYVCCKRRENSDF